jgi:acetyltransferase-like isoleucine patch superfamily enzyme
MAIMNRARNLLLRGIEQIFGRRVEFPRGISVRTFLTYYSGKGLLPLFRGIWHRLFVRSAGWPLFVGKGVTLRFSHLLACGRAVNLGDGVRIDALSLGGIRLGNRVSIREGSIIQLTSHLGQLGESVDIEDDVYIGPYAFIGAAARVRIGARTLVGPKLTIIAEEHRFNGVQSVFEQGVSRAGVSIGEDCWIGACVTILDGVQIGRDCVIGAGSVVTRSMPNGAVVYGVPARVQRLRKTEQSAADVSAA